jgi:ATP phosphoribosyltransferase
MSLILALPSKGRLKEQAETWLAGRGLTVVAEGGARGYAGRIEGFDDITVRLVSASEIAGALVAGEVHVGLTGLDLIGEADSGPRRQVQPFQPLGFGHADMVVAAPKAWIDVETMADVDDIARLYLARTGSRLRVATKYLNQSRAFFARHGVLDYRLVESGGATEGAPAAGVAELIVDITTTGSTLEANDLKILSDGVILRSQAHLAAALSAAWDKTALAALERLMEAVDMAADAAEELRRALAER